jgi:hypothetical protein
MEGASRQRRGALVGVTAAIGIMLLWLACTVLETIIR